MKQANKFSKTICTSLIVLVAITISTHIFAQINAKTIMSPMPSSQYYTGAMLRDILPTPTITTVGQPLIDLKFNSLPSAQGFTYFQSDGIPETSVFSVNGTSLIQDSRGIGQHNPNYAWFGIVDGSKPFVLTVRARILAYETIPPIGGASGFFFNVRTASPNQEYAIGLTPTRVTDPLGNGVSIDTTVFHTYVLKATPGGDYMLEVDGQLAFGGPFSATGGALNAVQLGDGNGLGGNARAEITKFEFSQGDCNVGWIPAFNWRQGQWPWGDDNYDHSYVTSLHVPNPNLTRVSSNGRMELMVGSNTYDIILSSTQNNLIGLCDAINRLDVGAMAVLKDNGVGSGNNRYYLSVYNTNCIQRQCPSSDIPLQLRTTPENEDINILQPRTIRNVGCALTTLAMALSFAGVTDIHTDLSLDPRSLNKFMSRTLTGIRQGGVFSEQGDIDFSNTTRSIGLKSGLNLIFDESVRGINSNVNLSAAYEAIDNILCSSKPYPVIVGVKLSGNRPNHYVLVTGKENRPNGLPSKYLIADPAGNGSSLDDYPGIFGYPGFVVRGFVKRHQRELSPATRVSGFTNRDLVMNQADDISEINFSIGDNADILIVDENGGRTGYDATIGTVLHEIPNSSYFIDALSDDISGEIVTGTTHSLQLFKPKQGKYQIIVTGLYAGVYSLYVHTYSQDGSEQPTFVIRGITNQESSSSFQVQLVSTPGSTSSVIRFATFQSTLTDISNSMLLALIDNQGIANSLSQKIEAASNAATKGKSLACRNILRAFKDEVNAQVGKHLNSVVAYVLLEDADSLISQLPE